jgi:serine protease Do
MKKTKSWRRIAMLAVPIWLAGFVNPAETAVVQCYDKARGVIQPRLEEKCAGQILDEAEAARIKAELRRERIRRATRPKSEREIGPRGHGTAFFVTADGKIVTNNHVIAGCKRVIWIDTTDGQKGTATVIGTDKANDLALLATTLKAPAVAVFRNPTLLPAGDAVTMIGYGTIKLAPIKPRVTPGVYQGSNRTGTRFQMKAAVRPGNSGGPVLDDSGYVVGVVYAQLNTVATFKKSGKLIIDRGFAISNPMVFRFLESLNVDFRRAPPRAPRSRDTIFREAKPFIARISCPR